jgi:shikimate dehydrogenase
MHNSGFSFIGFDGEYSKNYLEDGNNLKKAFLEGGFSGANITVPHKENAFRQADILDPLALKIGAVNTYILEEDGKIKGYNTDAYGFFQTIKDFSDTKSVLILGAGGTAKSIAVILRSKDYEVTILNRSQNSKEFFTSLGCSFYTYETFDTKIKYQLVVNSTSAGLSDTSLPAPFLLLEPIVLNCKYMVDCIYGKITPFLALAIKLNKIYKDGEDMLLYQGVVAFELFTHQKISLDTIEIMRKSLKNN